MRRTGSFHFEPANLHFFPDVSIYSMGTKGHVKLFSSLYRHWPSTSSDNGMNKAVLKRFLNILFSEILIFKSGVL